MTNELKKPFYATLTFLIKYEILDQFYMRLDSNIEAKSSVFTIILHQNKILIVKKKGNLIRLTAI